MANRAAPILGPGSGGSTDLVVDQVGKLVGRFFPSLSTAPTALQWDVLCRTASVLEKCGVALKLYNRTTSADVSKTDWKSANARAANVLAFLEDHEAKSDDVGASPRFQGMDPGAKFRTFKNEIDKLMRDEGLTVADAFAKLKETQPIFWTQALLSFDPAKQ